MYTNNEQDRSGRTQTLSPTSPNSLSKQFFLPFLYQQNPNHADLSILAPHVREITMRLYVIKGNVTTPINLQMLDLVLHVYNVAVASYLVVGFNFGFHLHFEGAPGLYMSTNHPSATKTFTLLHWVLSTKRISMIFA